MGQVRWDHGRWYDPATTATPNDCAATSAGMPCLITYTASTAAEDFYGEGAAAKVPDLGVGVTLDALFDVTAGAPLAEIASSVRDPKP